jgi:hypothetical protein
MLLLGAVYLGLGAGPAAADTDPVASRTPSSIDFGSQQPGTTSAPRTITVTAVSDGWEQVCDPTQRPPCEIFDVPTRISNLTIGGTDAAAFSVSSQSCTGRYLWQGESCSIDVTFSPAAAGNYSATLNINSNSSWSTGDQVQLSGNAPPPPTPPTDNFANAQSISGASATVNGTTLAATRETGEPDHYVTNPPDSDLWVGDHSVWYRWTAPTSGSTTIDTCTANIDSILAVYTGSALTNLSRVADNNNGCPSGWGSKVTFNASAGTTYQIAVGDAGGLRESTFTLKVVTADTTPPKVDSTSPANGATQIAPGANVTATFSEAMMTSSINGTTFKLSKAGTTTAIPAIVSYDPTTNKATLDPFGSSTTLLSKGTKYKAVVTTGAQDLAGNRLDQNSSLSGLQQKSWTFTTRN